MLDPHRIGLNAESIGFQKRMLQDLDYEAINTALQTDYNNQTSAIQVRREREAAKNEIRVMGGQLSGFESNELLLTYSRQQRQINGYPLRHFDANNPAVVLPKKYGGFPLYNRNQTEYPELVSVFTEPMSAPLQRDTELLGRAGAVAMTNDLNEPYAPPTFINPMSTSMDSLDQNKNVFKQRQHLQRMADTSRKQKYESTSGVGVFVNKDGTPMTSIMDEVADQIPEMNTFGTAITRHGIRAAQLMRRENLMGGGAGALYQDMNTNMGMVREGVNINQRIAATNRDNEHTFADAEQENVQFIRSAKVPLNVSNVDLPAHYFLPSSPDMINGMQPMPLDAGQRLGSTKDTPSRYLKTTVGARPRLYKGRAMDRWKKGSSSSAQKYRQATQNQMLYEAQQAKIHRRGGVTTPVRATPSKSNKAKRSSILELLRSAEPSTPYRIR
jgi:hypothetical protein